MADQRPSDEQIDQWYPRMYRAALRMTGDVHVAADLTQDAFCEALGHWDSFDGKALPTTWIYRILINCVRDWARRRRPVAVESIDQWDLPAARQGQDAGEPLARQEELAHLRMAVSGLSETLRPAFVATVLDGCTYLEASEMLSVPVGTIASRVHEARRRIMAAMRQQYPEAGQ